MGPKTRSQFIQWINPIASGAFIIAAGREMVAKDG
jgi:hypothetical protein